MNRMISPQITRHNRRISINFSEGNWPATLSVMSVNPYAPLQRYDIDNRYQQVMRISRTSHYQSMMQIHLTCVNAIDFVHNSFEQILSAYSTNKSSLNRPPLSAPATKKTPEAWFPMAAVTYPPAATSNPATTLNVVVSTREIVKESLWAENSQNCL